jgi:hypothetical protein
VSEGGDDDEDGKEARHVNAVCRDVTQHSREKEKKNCKPPLSERSKGAEEGRKAERGRRSAAQRPRKRIFVVGVPTAFLLVFPAEFYSSALTL